MINCDRSNCKHTISIGDECWRFDHPKTGQVLHYCDGCGRSRRAMTSGLYGEEPSIVSVVFREGVGDSND